MACYICDGLQPIYIQFKVKGLQELVLFSVESYTFQMPSMWNVFVHKPSHFCLISPMSPLYYQNTQTRS